MRKIKIEEWEKEGKELFGEDIFKWKYVCPMCGNVVSPEDFRQYKDIGATPNSAYSECIGRYCKGRSAFSNKKAIGKPCDYAAYGLINVCKTSVILPDGHETSVFEFAKEEGSGNMSNLMDYFYHAFNYVCTNGYESEIDSIDEIGSLESGNAEQFLVEYTYVVLNSGIREQIARKIYDKFMESRDFNIIGYIGKRNAIIKVSAHYRDYFKELQKADDKIEYLQTLPWIGSITKYHLARNIGIDTVKPDRHLVRLAEQFGFKSPLAMCQAIQKQNVPPIEKLGTIDVILWRYCNLTGLYNLAPDIQAGLK